VSLQAFSFAAIPVIQFRLMAQITVLEHTQYLSELAPVSLVMK